MMTQKEIDLAIPTFLRRDGKEKPMAEHAKLSPSSAHRWMNCPASAKKEAGVPNTSNFYAAQGTAAHQLIEELVAAPLLKDGAPPVLKLGRIIEVDGHKIEVDQEMIEACEAWSEYEFDLMKSIGLRRSDTRTEHRVTLKGIGIPEVWGTGDKLLMEAFGTLHVMDFKYGAGVPVDVKGNEQLMIYGLGALLEFGDDYDFEDVTLHIFQPRAPHKDGPARTWTISADKLRDWGKNVLAPAVKETEKSLLLSVGDWCQFCAVKATCPAQHKHAQAVARMEFGKANVVVPGPEDLTMTELAEVLAASKLVRDWLTSVEGYALDMLKKNQPVPGHKLVQKRGQRKWADEDKAARAFANKFGEDAYTEPALKSPAQMEKIEGAKGLVAKHAHMVSSGVTIAPDSDKRQAVDPLALFKADPVED